MSKIQKTLLAVQSTVLIRKVVGVGVGAGSSVVEEVLEDLGRKDAGVDLYISYRRFHRYIF